MVYENDEQKFQCHCSCISNHVIFGAFPFILKIATTNYVYKEWYMK